MTSQRLKRVIDGQLAVVECLHCGCTETVARDEDGGAGIEQWQCQHEECGAALCGQCSYFVCDYCDLRHCQEHLVEYSNLKLCPTCFAGVVADCCSEMVQ